MAATNAPWMDTVSEHFCSAYKCLIYRKNKDIKWCISHNSQIKKEAKDLKKIFFKQIKLKIVNYFTRKRLTKKCKKWLQYLANHGLGKRSTKKFRKFVKDT